MTPIAIWLYTVGCSDKDTGEVNAAPTISIVNPTDGASLVENDTLQMLAAVSDSDHFAQDLSVRWLLNGEVVCDWTPPDAGGNATCESIVSVDLNQIRAEVKDPEEASALSEISVFVDATEAPEVEIFTPLSGDTFYADQPIALTASVSDSDNPLSSLSVEWTSSIDGTLTVSAPDNSGQIADELTLSEGSHTLSLSAEDPDGKSAETSVNITVTGPNQIPNCEITNPINGEFSLVGDEVTFEGTATDPDISPSMLAVTWTSDKDGELSSGMGDPSGSVSFSSAELSQNTHQITLSVTDEMGLSCTDTIEYSIGSPPTLLLQLPYVDTLINEGDDLTFSAYVSDTEQSGSDLLVEWESDIDGQLYSGYAAANGISLFNSTSLSFGTHTISATVTDLDGLYATGTVSIIVNAIPTQPNVTITPDPATTTDTLTATASGSTDFDGTTPTYLYEWYQNGTLTSHTTATIAPTETLKNETWLVRVTPTDGITNGPFVESSVTLVNTPPTMSSISVSPTSPTTQDNITCSYSGSDVDPSDNLTYGIEWFVNNTMVSGSTDTLLGPFVQGDVVTCRVTPNDGADLGTFAEANTTVINTAPVVHSVTLSPSVNATNDIITATVDSSDLDNDALTHTWIWYVDNVAVQNTSNSNNTDTLDGTIHFEKNQQVYVEVTADDGVASDTSNSTTQTIVNTPPSAFNAFVDPLGPVAGADDLTCMVQTADIDGDSVSITYSWTVDGQNVGFTTNVIPTSQIADSEVWVCSIQAYDGTEYSPIITATTTVGANVEAAVGQDLCASAGLTTDGNYDLTSCLSDISITSGEMSDSSGYVLQMGAHYVYTPE